jgi:WD40 repeat protein
MLISGDGRILAANDGGAFMRIFDVPSGQQVAAIPLNDRAATPTAFLADGRLLTSGVAEGDFWRLDTGTSSPLGRTLQGHQGRVVAKFTPDGTEIITRGIDDHQVLLWDAATGQSKGPLLGGAVLPPVALSPDSTLLAAPGQDGGAVRLWDRASGTELAALEDGGGGGGGGGGKGDEGDTVPPRHDHAVAWSQAGGQVATASGGSVLVWDVRDARHPRLVRRLAPGGLPHPGVPDEPHPTFSRDGRWLAIDDAPGRTVTVFDTTTGRVVWSQRLDATGPLALAFSPDNTTLAVSYGTAVAGVVGFFDVKTGKLVREKLPTPTAGGVEFLRGGSVVMTTSNLSGRSIAQLWDAATLAPIGEPLSNSQEGTNSLSGTYYLARSPDGTKAIEGTTMGAAQIWDVDIERWVATACRIAGRNLTQAEWHRYLPGEPYRRTCPQWPEGP